MLNRVDTTHLGGAELDETKVAHDTAVGELDRGEELVRRRDQKGVTEVSYPFVFELTSSTSPFWTSVEEDFIFRR